MLNAGRVLAKGQILDHVWGHNPAAEGNVVEPCVSYLRRKVDQGEPRLIHTIRGVGYVLRIPPP
jgi:two-component system OmpR family response regulator